MNSLTEISAGLKRFVGLDPAVIGGDAIRHAVRERMTALGVRDMRVYAVLLRRSEGEMQQLIERIVVPETWFYRDEEPFRFLARFAISEWPRDGGGEVLRILSIPCSTGEEPYSIAMTLLSSGLTPAQFHIDAVDISNRALEAAKRGVYGKNSFRGGDLGFRNRYFERKGGAWQLCRKVADTVHFTQGNLLEVLTSHALLPYHIVFCRNLLIYFSPEAKAQALAGLDNLLARTGLLFVGHAEATQVASARLVEVDHPRTFAFRTKNPLTRCASPDPKPTKEAATAASHSDRPRQIGGRAARMTNGDYRLLAEALREADCGNLQKAVELCERHAAEHGPSAQAYFILGLVKEASGSPAEAEDLFNKAIYLDPAHYEGLIHLALLLRRRDAASAAILEQRARRVRSLSTS